MNAAPSYLDFVAAKAVSALKQGFKIEAGEVNPRYFADGVRILREHDASSATPSLFDLLEAEDQGSPEREAA